MALHEVFFIESRQFCVLDQVKFSVSATKFSAQCPVHELQFNGAFPKRYAGEEGLACICSPCRVTCLAIFYTPYSVICPLLQRAICGA
jgi:hypothetical protein